MKANSLVDVIEAWFTYNGTTGIIYWKEWVSPEWYKYKGSYNRFLLERAGKPVEFGKTRSGHLRTNAGGRSSVYAHHIAWVLTYGKLPEHYIDHIDGNPENNILGNLRDVPHNINLLNQRMRKDNSSGVTGVSWHKQCGKWRANVKTGDTRKNLGLFNTIEDAADARQKFFEEHVHLGYTERHGK